METIIVAIITAILGPIIVNYYVTKKQVEKGVKSVSENLPSWELLFQHDENGNRVEGSVDRLIEAVRNGYPVRIRFDRSNDHFEVMDAQWLFVDNDKKLVHASNSSQVSLIKDEFGNYFHPDDPYHYFVIVNNTGYHHARRVDVSGKNLKPTDSKRYMTWIGLVPPKP